MSNNQETAVIHITKQCYVVRRNTGLGNLKSRGFSGTHDISVMQPLTDVFTATECQ